MRLPRPSHTCLPSRGMLKPSVIPHLRDNRPRALYKRYARPKGPPRKAQRRATVAGCVDGLARMHGSHPRPAGVAVSESISSSADTSRAASAGGEDSTEHVGLVAGTEDSTPLQFAVALDEASYLQLDDVVVTLRHVPGLGPMLTSGIVTQVRARQEGASFGSDVFLISDGVLPARTQEIAEVSTTRVEPEVYVPPRPGEVVRRATGSERAQALYFDQMANRVPVGRGRDGAPIYVNMEFLDGTRGARGEREGPGLQRQGRGPAVPRPAQHPARRRPARAVRRARPARRAVRVG